MASAGVIAAVVHDVIQAEKFETLSDLADAVKCRCALLKIPYDAGAVTEAIQLVERTRPVVAAGVKPIRPIKRFEHIERLDDDVRPITRAEAADLWPRLVAAVQRTQRTA
jgi:hypothetical protein